MSTYSNPYCSIDKLRISKANGIRFVYLTSEGSFFEGDLINDNTLYNDMSNCGFNWEPFAQPFPCNGVIRFQFKWCDDRQPIVHMFKNGEFYYEFIPTLVSDTGGDDIYEQEINLSSDASLCDSCIDIRIATFRAGGFSVLTDSTQGSLLVRKSDNYYRTSIDSGYVPTVASTFYGGAILGAFNGTDFIVYEWSGDSWHSIYTLEGNFTVLKAFDNENWIFARNGGEVLISTGGVIVQEVVPFSSYITGCDGPSIQEIYFISNVPFSNSRIIARINGNWSQVYEYGPRTGGTGIYNFKYKNNKVYWIGNVADPTVSILSLSTMGNVDYTVGSGFASSIDVFSETMAVASNYSNVFFFNGSSWQVDSSFAAIRLQKSDSSVISSVCYESSDRVLVASSSRVYVKQEGRWSEISGGEYSIGAAFDQVIGTYDVIYDYHAQSEPLSIKDHDCLVRIEYWNDDDYDQQVFCSGFRNVTYIQAQFLGFKPMEDAVVYKTSRNNSRVLSSNLAKVSTLDIDYMPEYMHEILWRAFGFDNVILNNKSYTKEGEYVVQENAGKYSLWKASVELYENLFKFTNSNCNRNCALSNEAANQCLGIGEMEIGTTFLVYDENSCLNI